MPWYALTSGSVTAITMRNDDVRALDEKNFQPVDDPLVAVAPGPGRERVGSEPPWGSVIEYDEKISPSSSGRRYCSFCSSVP